MVTKAPTVLASFCFQGLYSEVSVNRGYRFKMSILVQGLKVAPCIQKHSPSLVALHPLTAKLDGCPQSFN